MPDPVTAIVGGGATIAGGLLGADAQKQSASKAAGAQIKSAELGVAETRRQFDAIQKLLAPYITAGTGALGEQQALLGLSGPDAQRAAIAGIEGSPQFQSLVQQGETGILQNAAATGGLRGGNVQGALAQFRPQLLSQLIESQFGKLGAIAGMGQASAAGQAAAGQAAGANIANLLGQQGAASAGAHLASGQAQAQMYGNIGQTVGNIATLKALKVF